MITFTVPGDPVPKQSTRFDGNGRAHTPARIKAWQDTVAWKAREAMQGREPIKGPVAMQVVFILGNRRRVDLDNLNKGVSDAMNGIIFDDDTQVVDLRLKKRVAKTPGIFVSIYEGECLPEWER